MRASKHLMQPLLSLHFGVCILYYKVHNTCNIYILQATDGPCHLAWLLKIILASVFQFLLAKVSEERNQRASNAEQVCLTCLTDRLLSNLYCTGMTLSIGSGRPRTRMRQWTRQENSLCFSTIFPSLHKHICKV